MEEINKRKASNGRRRAVSAVVNGSAVNDDLMKLQQENVEQRAQVNFLVIQLDEAKQRAGGLQDSFESERGRANRLAMVSVTLMNICQTSFPDARELRLGIVNKLTGCQSSPCHRTARTISRSCTMTSSPTTAVTTMRAFSYGRPLGPCRPYSPLHCIS